MWPSCRSLHILPTAVITLLMSLAASCFYAAAKTSVPGTSLGLGYPGVSCWVAARPAPPNRQCVLAQQQCVSNVSESDVCRICSRGWGVWPSYAACLAAPLEDPGFTPADDAEQPVDPTTYPSPHIFQSNTCSPRANAGDKTTQPGACPHHQPGLRLWEDDSVWPGGRRPVPGGASRITLPPATHLMITACTFINDNNVFGSITVPHDSALIFDDAHIHLRVGQLRVLGVLQAGSGRCRLSKRLTITFVPAPAIATGDMGLMVEPGGRLDLHGAAFSPTWSRLATTAAAGSTWVSLQQPVNWRAGQLVAVSTSIFRDETFNQNEVLTIAAVSNGGRRVRFTSALRFNHYGGPEYQSEVALLSRSILLQGPGSMAAERRGGHVTIQGQGRIRGVMAFRMGQRNVLGRYPFHFHMLGQLNGTDSYITDSAVYQSWYRCVTVHGTSGLKVAHNVGFHVDGSCFYVEDGVEGGNYFQDNFAGFVHVIGSPAGGVSQSGELVVEGPDRRNPADAAAAGFYAASPNQSFVGNAASGGWAGFSFPTLPAPINDFKSRTDVVPLQHPLGQFSRNTAHSSGYYWSNGGAIYFGGRLWHNDADGGKLYYSSGRWEHDPRHPNGSQAFHVLRDNKVWLAQWGLSHWGQRVKTIGWEAHDCTRGANIFGVAQLSNALVNARSANVWARYPGYLWDLDPIAGFRWYDTRVMTILSNVTFRNIVYQPSLGAVRQGAWFSMSHSDEFKPAHISSAIAIRYEGVASDALLHHEAVDTGSSRYFNFIDWDGSASRRGRPTLFGSWPDWWRMGPDCNFRALWNSWVCDWLPWRTVARLDASVPGYTARVDSGAPFAPSPANHAGYVAQFGTQPPSGGSRSMTITRNEGITGVTGTGGWSLHWAAGAPKEMQVFVTQLPQGTSLVFATRYPSGTSFQVARTFKWYSAFSAALRPAGSLAELLADPTGERFWFSGKHLYIKMTDPGDGTLDPPFKADGATVWGSRFFTLSYDIVASIPGCSLPGDAPQFCAMQDDPATDVPPALPADYNSWMEPYCVDVPPPGNYTCEQQKAWDKCGETWLARPRDEPHVAAIGGYCAVTCGACKRGQAVCVDRPVPGSLSLGSTCAQLRDLGGCYQAWMKGGGFCGRTCGLCNGRGPPCIDVTPTDGYSCAQRLAWGHCSQQWMVDGNFCRRTCGACSGGAINGSSTAPKPGCKDTQPPGGYTCAQQTAWGKCSEAWMVKGGWCAATCGRCTTPPSAPAACTDVQPPGGYTCSQQKGWGRCSDYFMTQGGYCRATCGACDGFQAASGDQWALIPPVPPVTPSTLAPLHNTLPVSYFDRQGADWRSSGFLAAQAGMALSGSSAGFRAAALSTAQDAVTLPNNRTVLGGPGAVMPLPQDALVGQQGPVASPGGPT